MGLCRRNFLAFSAAAVGLAGLVAVAAPSGAASGSALSAAAGLARVAGSAAAPSLSWDAAPEIPAGAVRLGAVSPASQVRVDVGLRPRDPAALTAFLNGLADRNSPYFQRFLKPGQFGPMFGPSPAQVTTVEDALRAAGLSPGQVPSDRLDVPVTGSAATIERAFRVSLVRYRLPGGRVAFANTGKPWLSPSAAPLVDGVVGLNDLVTQDLLGQPATTTASPGPVVPARTGTALAASAPARGSAASQAAPQACAQSVTEAGHDHALTATQLASHYKMSPLYGRGDSGQGLRVALAEFSEAATSDIDGYQSCYGISIKGQYIAVDGGAGLAGGSAQAEATLDIEDVAGLAPGVYLDVYQTPGSDQNVADMFQAIADADTDKVVSVSFGRCELLDEADEPGYEAVVEPILAQADGQGQSVFISSGDDGSSGCIRSDSALNNVSASFPATSPYVIAVGGTTIRNGTDTVWNESSLGQNAGASGGGVSTAWCMPGYQYVPAIPGLVNADSQAYSACTPANAGGLARQVPDVSADADWDASGYSIYLGGEWQPNGGTSAAAPLWAAIAALIDDSPFCAAYGSGDVGVLPQDLYAMMGSDYPYVYGGVAEGFTDIPAGGNNDFTPYGYTGGLYPTGPGFDEATGLGAPIVSGVDGSGNVSMYYPGLAALICQFFATRQFSPKVTSISPHVGAAGHAVTVTVHGSGFLPVAGADMARVTGGREVGASCATTTSCQVRLPAMTARTVNIQISAEDLSFSPVTSADRFQYVAAPHVLSLSPKSGTHRGGTTVTIRGTSFIGVKAVHFGRKLGTHLRVVSATEIVVTVPAGSAGTVHVTVTAVGGTSNPVHYKYT